MRRHGSQFVTGVTLVPLNEGHARQFVDLCGCLLKHGNRPLCRHSGSLLFIHRGRIRHEDPQFLD